MGEIGDHVAVHLQVDRHRRAAEPRMRRRASHPASGKPAEPRNRAGEFEDALVVDVVEHEHGNIGDSSRSPPLPVPQLAKTDGFREAFPPAPPLRASRYFATAAPDAIYRGRPFAPVGGELSDGCLSQEAGADAGAASRPVERPTPRGGRGRRPHPDRAGPATTPTARASVDTPRRVARAYEEFYAGYGEKAGRRARAHLRGCRRLRRHRPRPRHPVLSRTASTTWCRSSARRMSPTIPTEKVVGLSKLARVVDVFARRLQTQERLTARDRRRDRRGAEAARHRRHDRGGASVHDAPRRAQARRIDRDDAVHRRLPRRSGRAAPLPDARQATQRVGSPVQPNVAREGGRPPSRPAKGPRP